ncbi:MAG: phosphoglycerate kinase [archaeon]|nr:phosphoglycerate kinase [archaeon]
MEDSLEDSNTYAENYEQQPPEEVDLGASQEEIKEKENKEDGGQKVKSQILFNSHNLFIRSIPNKIGFDKVSITNTGNTCIYFKWQKKEISFELKEKKSEGIDRFFCHYSDSKIFPNETKEFVFSFFSEKDGVFSEDWELQTSPDLSKMCNLNLHLNGLVHLYIDKYSEKINKLNEEMKAKEMNTVINEIVMDMVENVKINEPPLPDMTDHKTFKFYFEYLNKEYNIHFSNEIMEKMLKLYLEVDPENKFWNGAIDELKEKINKIEDEEKKNTLLTKLNIIIHDSRRKFPEDSPIFEEFKKFLIEKLDNFNDIVNEVRDECQLAPRICDWLTRETLTEQELTKYKADLKKKEDEYNKKANKKKAKNAEEEQQEQEEYKNKLYSRINEIILNKCENLKTDGIPLIAKEEALKANKFDEDYVTRLDRVKTFRDVKAQGGFDNKYVVLRIDIENYQKKYEDKKDEEGNVVGKIFKEIDFMDTNDKMLLSLDYLLKNGVKAVLLLVDFGPKFGREEKEYSLESLRQYIESAVDDQPTFFAKDMKALYEYLQQMEDEELKDNCVILMENLNFFKEEISLDEIDDEVVNPNKEQENICLYRKNKFLEILTKKTVMYINDSVLSFDKYYPSIIDMNVPVRVIGQKIGSQLRKIIDFFSIENKEYLLIVGDNDVFRTNGKNTSNPGNSGTTYQLEDSDLESFMTSLLIMNSIMGRFKKIFIFGKLALQFIQFLRKDYTLFDNSKYAVNEKLFPLMKYILVKASLLNIEIFLPEDIKVLEKNEYQKHLVPLIVDGIEKNYTKEVKVLLKREIIQGNLEEKLKKPTNPGDEEEENELDDDPDYARVKLEPEQIETLKLYKTETIKIKRAPYFFDIVNEFIKAQNVSKPKKIFKTPQEIYAFNESIYDKEIVYPEEILTTSEWHKQREEKRIQKIKEEEEEAKKLEEEAEQAKAEEKDIKDKTSPKKEAQEEKKDEKKEEENKVEGEGNEEPKEEPKPKKKYDPRLYNYDELELVDFGEKSYDNLTEAMKDMHGIMWLGKLSPNKVENVFDNYPKILGRIQEIKKKLKYEFEMEQATQAKKLNETELKARKFLLNVFLKSNSVYEVVKDNFKNIEKYLAGNPLPTVDELMNEEEEEIPDEEQFNHDMHKMIDYYINDDFELINQILMGKHLPGFYGLSMEKPVEKEEEFDPKILEEITN